MIRSMSAAAIACAALLIAACGSGSGDSGGEMAPKVPKGPIRAIVLVDDGWGSNLTLDDESPSILGALESFGWELTIVGAKAAAAPCPLAKGNARSASVKVRKKASEIEDVDEYDAVVVAPGRSHRGLAEDPAVLGLLRSARSSGLAIGSFCRGLSVLAAAGVVSGSTVTGHPDARSACEAAGARFMDYADSAGKGDAPPPVVDGALATSLRSKYFRAAACESIRVAADNARRARTASALAEAARRNGSIEAGAGSAAGLADSVARWPDKARRAAFAFMLERGTVNEAALLAGSLRAWGGAMSDSEIVAMVPDGELEALKRAAGRLESLGCRLVGFAPDPRLEALPLAMKAAAAAEAERLFEGRVDELVWMDTDTVVTREPSELLLPAGSAAAVTPVHHRLIGRRWDDAPDAYWIEVFRVAGADRASDFGVLTVVDREAIGAYFNAGLLALRPSARLLRAWRDRLAEAGADPALKAAIKNSRHELFLHQAVLSAVLLAGAGPGGIRLLSYGFNYPLHMHGQAPSALRPAKLDDVYTLRYDEWGKAPGRDGGRIEIPARMAGELERLIGD